MSLAFPRWFRPIVQIISSTLLVESDMANDKRANDKRYDRKPKSSRARKRRLARKQTNALNFETLEPRRLLATIAVSNATDVFNAFNTSSIGALLANDGGDGISLREAITAANNTFGEDTITFDGSVFTGGSNNLIRLTQGELVIDDSLSIDGSSVGGVVITGDANGDDVTFAGSFITDVAASFGGTAGAADDLLDDNSRVLNSLAGEIGTNRDVTLTGLTITGGRTTETGSSGGGGVLFSAHGALTLNDSVLSGNSTRGGFARGGGLSTTWRDEEVFLFNSTVSRNSTDGSEGGGIFSRGDLTLVSSIVSENSTSGDQAKGGGIKISEGILSLTNSTVSGNSTSGENAWGGGIDSKSRFCLS